MKMRTTSLFLLLLLATAVVARGSVPVVPTVAQMVALIEQTPQLRIDPTVDSSGHDAKTQPWVAVKSAPEGEAIGGFALTGSLESGTLHDGTFVVALPLDSGGSGTVFTQIIFAGASSATLHYVGYLDSGGHLGVAITDGTIVARYPDYSDGSPNCCPKKLTVETYTIVGGALKKLSTTSVPAPQQ
jgi:hypothetical protein